MAKNRYELTYIVNGVLSDDNIKKVVARVARLIEENGGTIIETDEWGTRRLAYQINKKRNGYYVNLYFDAEGDLIARLERSLEIDDDILRYLTLRMDAKMIRHHEAQKTEAERARLERVAAEAAAAEEEDEEDEDEEDEDEYEDEDED